MKSKLLLLDANVVIEAHRLKLWKTLYTQYEVSLPSVVLQREVQFFKSKRDFGSNEEIALKPLVAIKALGALSIGYTGISLEELLTEVGQPHHITKLPKHFKKQFFENHLRMGRTESTLLLS